MTPFQQMAHKVTSSAYHNKMLRFVKPLEEHFGVNHFWYYRITNSGHYSFVGTHTLWNEYTFAHDVFGKFPYLRHPDTLESGISLMKTISDDSYINMLNLAAEKFDINLHIHLLKKIPEGVEGYGFGTHQKLNIKDELFLNELPLLTQFVKRFREENDSIFKILYDNQVDLASHIGPSFYPKTKILNGMPKRDEFLRKMGQGEILSLAPQERQVFKALANGFPAHYIADDLSISKRTVEHYIEKIKQKLFIDSRVELIEKAKEYVALDQSNIGF